MGYKIAQISPEGIVLKVFESDDNFIDVTTHPMVDQIGSYWTVKGKNFYAPVMVEFARIDQGVVAEVVRLPSVVDPAAAFPSDIASALVKLPDGHSVTSMMLYEDGKFSPQPAAPEPDAFEIAKAAFNEKWPTELQLQAALEKIEAQATGGEALSFDELAGDRELLRRAYAAREETLPLAKK